MKPRAYFCTCVQGEVSLDHWTSGACPKPPLFLPFLLGIIANTTGDTEHCDGKVTATRTTSCPRQTLIQDFIGPDAPGGGLVFDPRRYNSIAWGWAMHEWCAKYAPPDAMVEVRFPSEGKGPAILDFGEGVKIPVSGRLDYLSPDKVMMVDIKTHSEASHKFKWQRPTPDADLIVQFNILRTLVQLEIPDAPITKGAIWHGAQTSAKHPAPPWFEQPLPIVPLTEIGGLKCKGAHHTVREIASMLHWGTGEIQKIEHPRDSVEWYGRVNGIINSLPMVGEPMFNGDCCPTYCGAAQPYCFRLAGRSAIL